MTRSLIIVGAGEFGREVHTWVQQAIAQGAPWVVKGFLDDRSEAIRGFVGVPPILSSPDAYSIEADDVFLCAIGTPVARKVVSERLAKRGARFTTFVHPTALVGRNVRLGEGTILCPFTQLSCDITVGRLVTLGTFSNSAHDTTIGDYAQISGSCEINGGAVIEEGAYLGSHVTILPRARIGAYAYVGAGSVVLRRVRAGVKVFGNPAVSIGLANSG